MNKPQSLRHALNKAVPYVRNNPDKLHLFVDNGSLVATGPAPCRGVPLHTERGD
ncbi:phage tail protein [Escherichia coli]|nr:phage tail protein [Escherichia coli]